MSHGMRIVQPPTAQYGIFQHEPICTQLRNGQHGLHIQHNDVLREQETPARHTYLPTRTRPHDTPPTVP